MDRPPFTPASAVVCHAAFAEIYRLLSNRISLFTALPVQSLERLSLQRRLADIGNAAGLAVQEPT